MPRFSAVVRFFLLDVLAAFSEVDILWVGAEGLQPGILASEV